MIKALIGKVFAKAGYRIVKKETKEDQAFNHQKQLSLAPGKKVVFDVGAYTGETALRYHNMFEGNCSIYAFEPFPETFEMLKSTTADYDNIVPIKSALGNNNEAQTFHSNNFSATNSLLPSAQEGFETWESDILKTQEIVKVPVQTLDSFVEEHGIDRIDILKMDTQGSEYMVLEGASGTIRKGLIKMIYCEINVMPSYEGQKHYDEMFKIIRDLGFTVFNLIPSFNPAGQLRYLDALFVFENHQPKKTS